MTLREFGGQVAAKVDVRAAGRRISAVADDLLDVAAPKPRTESGHEIRAVPRGRAAIHRRRVPGLIFGGAAKPSPPYDCHPPRNLVRLCDTPSPAVEARLLRDSGPIPPA